MNKKNFGLKMKFGIAAGLLAIAQLTGSHASAQGLHFSQYYNAPMLQNPANTGLMSDYDYRVGANYRNQWSAVPSPYKSFSAYADFQAMRQKNQTSCWELVLLFIATRLATVTWGLRRCRVCWLTTLRWEVRRCCLADFRFRIISAV